MFIINSALNNIRNARFTAKRFFDPHNGKSSIFVEVMAGYSTYGEFIEETENVREDVFKLVCQILLKQTFLKPKIDKFISTFFADYKDMKFSVKDGWINSPVAFSWEDTYWILESREDKIHKFIINRNGEMEIL